MSKLRHTLAASCLILAVSSLVVATGCGPFPFFWTPGPGTPCSSDDNCESGSRCLEGYCSGGSCTCTNGNCRCPGKWECRENEDRDILDPSTGTCVLPCESHSDCPDTWGCSAGTCSASAA